MRIWIINHYALPPSHAGGTRHHSLAKELIARGHEVIVIASSLHYHTRTDNVLLPGETARYQDEQGVPFLWLRTPAYSSGIGRIRNMLAFTLRVWRGKEVRKLPPPDIIIGSSVHLGAVFAAERLAQRYHVPFVMEVRDLWPQTLVDLGEFSPRHPAIQALYWLERFLYRRAARIITLGPGMGSYIEAHGSPCEKATWIPNGVDLRIVPGPTPAPNGNPLVAVYAGAHGVANALGTIIEAAAILQAQGWAERVLLRLVGDGPEKPRLAAQAEALGLRNVVFEASVPKTKVFDKLAEADILLASVRRTGLYQYGISLNKLFDYMAVARPIVWGAGDCVNDPVAESGAGITTPPEDPQAMAEGIMQIAQMSPEQRYEMGLRGRRYVEQNHDFANLAQRIEQLLEQCIR